MIGLFHICSVLRRIHSLPNTAKGVTRPGISAAGMIGLAQRF